MSTPPFRRVLVANRGEIAIRVFRTLRDLGIESVAIYSDADRDALHVRHADHAYAIGGDAAADSYLRQDIVLDMAKRAGADAIHPGYGFLAENAEFARACEAAGIVFIGPPASAIDAMGSKTASRELMRDAGVPIVPGSVEPLDVFDDHVRAIADEVGFPIAVKARSGGGGKGFRVALTADDLQSAFEGASREGERYFSDGAVYLERYLHDPRHVEVQLLADTHGNVIHLGERDCSVQRRHQKLIEEAPGPHAGTPAGLDLREKLGKIAVDAARAVGYVNAGTIECLLGADGEPYFLEMNTRVQVEHTVTEMITGIDIVAEQLYIAAGQPLRRTQENVRFRGHSVEVRINAEDARHDFRPSSGTITRWNEPTGPNVRVDAGFDAGTTVTPFYDTLIAKLVVWGETRDAAIARMRRALDEFDIEGIETLVDFHRAAMVEGGEFEHGGTCRDLVADPGPAMDALPELRGRTLSAPPRPVRHPQELLVEIDGKRAQLRIHDPANALPEPPLVRARTAGGVGAPGDVSAPIPGNVLQVLVRPGQIVKAGEVVCILEAMKMENEIGAPAAGTVEAVRVSAGDAVAAGHVLVSITPDA